MSTAGQEVRVLSTLKADGSRLWLRPHLSPGAYLRWRRIVGYFLILVFTVLPHLRINGKPPILLDIPAREFTFWGTTLYPTDSLLLAVLVVTIFLTVFCVTALFGRVWCGWGCPQTVYMELVYRPIERFFEGKPGRKAKPGAWRKPAKYAVYLLVSMFLAHTFLAYFVGTDRLWEWVQRSPLDHPVTFLVMVFVTGLMLLDFGFLREQVCIVMCPYGRFQSVMLDKDSLIISYDEQRGEPRGKAKKPKQGDDQDVSLKVLGDCVDCGMCVRTCPTGIDIRDGLQMECVGCAQCIDACDAVMDKLGRDPGLIRYSSQAVMSGQRKRLLRPRVAIYATLIVVLVSAFVVLLAVREPVLMRVLRGSGATFVVRDDGVLTNQITLKVHNRSAEPGVYSVGIEGLPGAQVVSERLPLSLAAFELREVPVEIRAPVEAFYNRGYRDINVVLRDDGPEGDPDNAVRRRFRILGPSNPRGTQGSTGGRP